MTALRHELLDACGVEHGFGVRGEPERSDVARPVQVHGVDVAGLEPGGALYPERADAVVSRVPRHPIGVVTADCVPILAACESGGAVAAIHAGWRGLAAGVIESGLARLRACAPGGEAIAAVVGPHIGDCCYEVDEPVWSALRPRFGDALDAALRHTRPGHAQLALARLADVELERAGIAPAFRAVLPNSCTRCDAERFHSYRRDGPRAGRLLHRIAAR